MDVSSAKKIIFPSVQFAISLTYIRYSSDPKGRSLRNATFCLLHTRFVVFEIDILFPVGEIIHNPFFFYNYTYTIKIKLFIRMSWLITSKAFDRSQKIDKVYIRRYKFVFSSHWLNRCKTGWIVECFLRNPYLMFI